MITLKEYLKEGKRGLWDNIHAKQERIKNGSGERMRKPGSKGAPTAAALKASQTNEEIELDEETAGDSYEAAAGHLEKAKIAKEGSKEYHFHMSNHHEAMGNWHTTKGRHLIADKEFNKAEAHHDLGTDMKEEFEAQFDLIEQMVSDIAEQHNLDPEIVWEKFEEVSDEELLEAAVDAKGYKSSTGGLTQKGRDHYNNTEGGHLKAPVTTKPSKLKAGSKAANRRKSFCARMSGVEGPMKKPNGEPSRKALALRKWNC